MTDRVAGILLHPTSFPSPDGIGDLGAEAYRWIDFLKIAGCQLWQVLPLGPTGYGDSPYQCFSAFAGNPFLISPLLLLADNLISLEDLSKRPAFPADYVDFGGAIIWKNHILDLAYQQFAKSKDSLISIEFREYCHKNEMWINDFSIFMAIKESENGAPWSQWPKDLKFRDPVALESFCQSHSSQIEKHKFTQYLFFKQWNNLHQYAKEQGIRIVGDIPFVVALDSADVWSHPEYFLLDQDLNPTVVAGVPPDYFSATGQLWGNPLYDWQVHSNNGYKWWVDRLQSVLLLVDLVRFDHFRGFAAAWQIPFGNTTAVNGEWVKGPGSDLFEVFNQKFPDLPIIAEDLGFITPDVKEIRDRFNLPGMKILQFAFSGDPEDDFLPHHYPINCYAYTGSHDNDTAKGWYDNASPKEQDFCRKYLNVSGDDISWSMMRAIWQSIASHVVVPMQDVLALGTSARMNLPGSTSGNWCWRMRSNVLTDHLKQRLWELNFLYSRLPAAERNRFTEKINMELGAGVKPH